MTNRNRNHGIYLMLNDEEKSLFEKKMKLNSSKNMSHFIRKCLLEKDIYVIDMKAFYDLHHLVGVNANNLNQIAKATNTTGVIYKKDVDHMREKIEKLSKEIWDIHSMLLRK